MRFPMGRLRATLGALVAVSAEDIAVALDRHLKCDWGDVCETDKHYNNEALKDCTRLLSAYHTSEGLKFWIITEADRSSTTVLLPDEY